MSAYSAPERNTGAFISGYYPKKIFSTDHTHSGFGVGDVKKSGSNDFTGTNSFSNETTFSNTNPITLETESGSTTLKFKESDTTHGTIEFRTADITDGDLRILANRVALKTSAGTDAVSISSDKMTTTSLPECSATPSTANQLINKTYADTKVGKSGNETVAGVKNFTNNVGVGTSSPQRGIHIHTTNDSGIQFTTSGTGSGLENGARITMSATEFNLVNRQDGNMRFWTHGQERVRIDGNGNVGIGTTSPEQKLHIAGNMKLQDNTFIYLSNNNYMRIRGTNDNKIQFYGNGNPKITMNNNGDLGIGTTTPTKAKVEINGSINYYVSNARYFTNSTSIYSGVTSQSRPLSLYTSNMIATHQLHVFSDERIKKNITEVPDNLSLNILRDLPIKYYNYVDDIQRGTNRVIGFIAQEVKDILPNAVAIEKDTIPDEYRLLEDFSWKETEDGKFHLSCDLQNCRGIKYKFKVSNNPDIESEDIEIVANDDNTFTFDKQYSHIFLYGREVDDFHRLDKAQIFAVGMSALQEVDRQLQAEKAKVSALEARISALENPST